MRTTNTAEKEEKIRSRAHLIWEERILAAAEGDALSDWLQAEKEVEAEERGEP